MMRKFGAATLFGLGLIIAAATAQAQTVPPPGTPWPNYPVYNYNYPYPGYGYSYGSPYTRDYLGEPYPAPQAFWDPYVWYRPYSDNSGPKASGHGGF